MNRVRDFYLQAWRSSVASPTGRRVWLILLLKIAILLVLFKVLFFPNRLAEYGSEAEKAEAVRTSLITNY